MYKRHYSDIFPLSSGAHFIHYQHTRSHTLQLIGTGYNSLSDSAVPATKEKEKESSREQKSISENRGK